MDIPASPVLRPLRLGELLDHAIRLYRRNFLTFVGIIALVYIPYVLMQMVSSALYISSLQALQGNPEGILTSAPYWLSFLSILFVSGLYTIFVSGLGAAALTNAVARSYLGQKTGILEAYRQLGSSWFHLLVTILLFGLLVSVAFTWTMVPIVGWFTGFGLLVFMAGIVGELLPATVVIEKHAGLEPIARAWNLARRRFWWLLGFSLIFYLFNLLVVTGPTFLVNALASGLIGRMVENGLLISTLISGVAAGLLHLLTLPIQITAWTLVYFDLRVRTEGFDLALATLETPEGAEIEIASLPIPTSEQNWLTGEDIGKFVAISLAFFGIIALIAGAFAAIIVFLAPLRGG
jgi:hypothetical protein